MRDVLDQLYKTKLQLLAVLSTVAGLALLLLARWTEITDQAGWLMARSEVQPRVPAGKAELP